MKKQIRDDNSVTIVVGVTATVVVTKMGKGGDDKENDDE